MHPINHVRPYTHLLDQNYMFEELKNSYDLTKMFFAERINNKYSSCDRNVVAHAFLHLTREHIKDDLIESFKPIFIKVIKNLYAYNYSVNLDTRLSKQDKFKKLTPQASERISKELDDISNKHAINSFKKFESGKVIKELITPDKLIDPISINAQDFIGFENTYLVENKTYSQIRKDKIINRLNTARLKAKSESNIDRAIKIIDEHRLFLRIVAEYIKTNPDLSSFTKDQFEEVYPKIREDLLRAEESNEKEAAAKKAEEELLAMPPKQGPKKGTGNVPTPPLREVNVSKNASAKQKLKPTKVINESDFEQSDLIKRVQNLNSTGEGSHVLSSRVKRWSIRDSRKISGFQDRDPSGAPIFRYAGLTLEQLVEQQTLHNLGGIKRILSDERLAAIYSLKYIPRGNSTDGRIGRCFYAEMNYKGKNTLGLVNVGIGKDNTIFHALFTPVNPADKPTIDHFFNIADSIAGKDEIEESGWENVSTCSYELLDEMLVMNIRRVPKNPNENVKFTFRPLKNANFG